MTDYQLLAEIYEPLGHLYTGGAIRETKRAAAAKLQPGDRVLCVGGGAGEEARLAAEAGAHVTLIDRSPDMLRLARRSLAETENVTLIELDLDAFRLTERFRAVWSHFFLNVFARTEAKRKLTQLAALVAPGGSLVVSDFAPGGWARHLYFGLPLVAFCALTGNAWHAIYDYATWSAGELRLATTADFPVFRHGPQWLRQWTWQNNGGSRGFRYGDSTPPLR